MNLMIEKWGKNIQCTERMDTQGGIKSLEQNTMISE